VKFFSNLKSEIKRHWRSRYREEMKRRGEPIPSDFVEQEPDDGDLQPPDARRVARRACCLSAVALRGLASTWDHDEQEKFLPSLKRWLAEAGLDDEFEADERKVIQTSVGELDQQQAINSCWRWEGAAVLAASLGRLALPPHDQMVDTQACGDACGVLAPRVELDRLIDSAAFDAEFDCLAYANHVLAIHWRLRQFVHIEPKSMDFADFARGVQWAQFNLESVRLIDGDLAIGDHSIIDADPADLQTTMSITQERHLAANWLIGWDPTYSEVDTST